MSFPIAILAVLIAGLVVFVVGAPLRAARRPAAPDLAAGEAGEQAPAPVLDRDELDAARESKYREIRDAELDFRTGKLSSEDYQAIDTELRAEAIEILDRLQGAPNAAADAVEEGAPASSTSEDATDIGLAEGGLTEPD